MARQYLRPFSPPLKHGHIMELWYEQGLHARLKPQALFCPGKATVSKARRPMGSSVEFEKVILGHPFNRNYLIYKCEYIIGNP